MERIVEVPERVRSRARALGAEGERWLLELPDLIDQLESDWGIRVGGSQGTGFVAYLAAATTSDGTPAVLKIALPEGLSGVSEFRRELRCLLLGGGDPYVDVLKHDESRRVVLLERLGQPLANLGLSVTSQIEVIARTVPRGWRRVDDPSLPTGAEKARWLREFILAKWDALDRPCSERTVEFAVSYTQDREAAFDMEHAVLVHGDVHPWNVLEAGAGTFKLIDPEGLLSEPAHDLGIPLRDWSRELLAVDCRQVLSEWCDHLCHLTRVDRDAIWQWALIERVSTGLNLAQHDHAEDAHRFLHVADLITEA